MALSVQNLLNYSSAGIIIPDTSAIREMVIQEMEQAVFQQSIDASEETALGRLIESLTSVFAQIGGLSAWMAEQMNLNYSTGVFLDAWAANFGISRKGASNSTVICTCQGVAGTTIPQGSLVANSNNDMFSLDETITLDTNGSANGYFTAIETGDIQCGANTVNVIATAIVGWTSVNNSSAGIPGSSRESDYSLRQRILSGNMNGDGYTTTLYKRLLQIDGVKSVCVLDNTKSTDDSIKGITVPGHSVFICVKGGDDIEIANVIFRTKPFGTGYYTTGITPVSVSDEYGNSGSVYFKRPTDASVGTVRVDVTNVSYGGQDLKGDIEGIVNEFLASVGIGGSFTQTQLAVAIQNGISGIIVTQVIVSDTSFNGDEMPIAGTFTINISQ